MSGLTRSFLTWRFGAAAIAAAFGVLAWAAAPAPAAAQFPFGFGWGWGYPRYYAPYPYYPPPAYYPYYPPPAYYPAPAPAEYAPPVASATPGAVPGSAPTATPAPAPTGAAQITYTSRPAFTNAAGQTCREYTATEGAGATPVYGTACRDAGGQWRVAN
jgi:hypothetical protein